MQGSNAVVSDKNVRVLRRFTEVVLPPLRICSGPLTQTGAAIKVDEAAPEPDEAMVQAGCTAVVAIKVCVCVSACVHACV
jgi:hypothetical protein